MKEKIYVRKDGRYEIRYAYGINNEGKTNYKSVYAYSEEEVVGKYEKIKRNFELTNDLLFLDKTYIGYDICRWLNSVKIRCKKSTYSNYMYIVNARIIPEFAMLKKKNITSELIDRYTMKLLNKGLLPKTVKDILIILQQILISGGVNIKISMPKIPKNEIQILKKEEQLLLEENLLKDLNKTKMGIYLCLYTGLRIGEICSLKWENIDLNNKKIRVKNTITRIKNFNENNKFKKTMIIIDNPKSSSSIRDIPLPRFIVPLLKTIDINIKPSNYLISGTDKFIETRTFFNRYKKILKEINLEKYNFHALRHTFATRCIENGCDPKTLSEILGHSSVKITLERYVHPNYENKVRMMNQLKPMIHK